MTNRIVVVCALLLLATTPSSLWARGGGGCFEKGTLILTPAGPRAIEMLRPGDELLAFTPQGAIVRTTVRSVLMLDVDDYVVVRTERVTLRVTADHPFYVGAGTYKTPEVLRAGDAIMAYDGTGLGSMPIIDVEHIHARTRVYNLQTDEPHTFFAHGIAVHNKGGGGGGHGGGFGGGDFGGGGFRGGWHGGSRGTSNFTYSANPSLVLASGIIGTILGIIGWALFGNRRFIPGYILSGLGGGLTGICLTWCTGIGILLLIFLVPFLIRRGASSKRAEDLDFVYSCMQVDRKTVKTRRLLEFLAQQDSTVEPETLRKQAEATCRQLQHCWEARDYTPMKLLLMPDLYTRHCAQLRTMNREHEINRIADLHIDKVEIVNIRYTDKVAEREFTALITARARDYYIDDRTHTFLRGDREPARFQEFWTFHRQGDAWLLRDVEQSRESDVLKEENFVEMFTDQQLQKIYREVAGVGPAGPWLEKQVETKTTRIERLLNFLVRTDKLWDQKRMQERARQVFLHVYQAQESGVLAETVTDELFPEVAQHLREEIAARQQKGITLEYRNLCIRKVELILVRNFRDNNDDEYTVRIRAHSQRVMRRGGQVIAQDDDVSPFEEYWTFGRRDGQWKLKEVLPPARSQEVVAQENLDEDSSPQQVQWYYRQTRAL